MQPKLWPGRWRSSSCGLRTPAGKIFPFREEPGAGGDCVHDDSTETPILGDAIAGIIWKRLDEGIPLGIDATTRYEIDD